MSESTGDVETELSRDTSLFDSTVIGVGALIGDGWSGCCGSGSVVSLTTNQDPRTAVTFNTATIESD